jgi:hypothetical protein
MPNESNSAPLPNLSLNRVCQISESHCGPAVIQMLLANLGIAVTQEAVAEAGGATSLIDLHGMRVDQLALAVKELAPAAQFWYKDNATLEDLIALIIQHRYPVGVEWQGLFDTDPTNTGEEAHEEDYGHFSVVTHVDLAKQELIIADPYKDFVSQDRIFSFNTFVKRWWDTNEVPDPATGTSKLVEDYHMLFIVTPTVETFPSSLGLAKAY